MADEICHQRDRLCDLARRAGVYLHSSQTQHLSCRNFAWFLMLAPDEETILEKIQQMPHTVHKFLVKTSCLANKTGLGSTQLPESTAETPFFWLGYAALNL